MNYCFRNLAVACLIALSGTSTLLAQEPQQIAKPQTEGIQWLTDYEQAKALAKKESKPLFLYFTGSDWCGWCKKTDREILSTKEFQQAIGNSVIFVKIDFPHSIKLDPKVEAQNQKLAEEFKIRGFPSIVLVSPDLQIIDRMGYQAGGGLNFARDVQKRLDAYSKKK